MAVKTAADAMDEALKSLGTASTTPPADETPPDADENEEEDAADGAEGDESGEDAEGDAEGEETDEGTEGEETEDDAEGEETDEEIDAAAPETPEAKATREAAEKAAARKPPNHLEDPLNEKDSKRTNDRVRFLVDEVKTLKPRAEQGDELIGYINQSGMSADEFSMALTFGRLKHSDNVEDNRQAYQILLQGIKEIAPLIGEVLPWADPLEGHPDLQAKVAAKTLDVKDAAELAKARNRDKAGALATQRAVQNRTAGQQQAAQTKQLEDNSRQELNELGQQLMAVDPHFEKKMELLKKQPKGSDGLTPLQRIGQTPPQMRSVAFLKAFRAIKYTPKPVIAAKPGNQPLRANRQPASGGAPKREAKSAVEAMDFALGQR